MRALLLALVALATPALGLVDVPPDVAIGVHTVDIVNLEFHPQVLVVGIGTQVTWVNHDDVEHTASDATGAWDTGELVQDQAVTLTFAQPGVYVYRCLFHSTMYGVLVVAAEP